MSPTGISWVDAVVIPAILVGAILVLLKPVRAVCKALHEIRQFLRDWHGEPGRPGVEARPGVMPRLAAYDERLTSMEHQMYRNGGFSLRDEVDRHGEALIRIETHLQKES